MNYRPLGNTGLKVSEVSFGTWAIGGAWSKTNDTESLKALEAAISEGVNFFDTADVYGDGHSEQLLAKATKGKEDDIHIATIFCRRGDIHDTATYSERQVREYCEDSLRNLQREVIDLYQIHCPPKAILEDGAVFEVLDKLKADTKLEPDDHRNFNRNGESFKVGETFAGLPFEKGVELANELRWIAEGRGTMARAAQRWILDCEQISCIIPGFRNTEQVKENLPTLDTPVFPRRRNSA